MTDQGGQAEFVTCEHVWAHTHYPGALVYYIGTCMVCGYLDVEDLNRQIRDLAGLDGQTSQPEQPDWAAEAAAFEREGMDDPEFVAAYEAALAHGLTLSPHIGAAKPCKASEPSAFTNNPPKHSLGVSMTRRRAMPRPPRPPRRPPVPTTRTGDPMTRSELSPGVEAACEVMHDAYERAAIGAGWETQERSRKPWADVPEANKATMRAAVIALLDWLDP